MEKIKRNERVSAIIAVLCQSPNRTYTLSDFQAMFGSAKSSLSEDIAIAKQILKKYDLGEIHVSTGAAGGVRFVPVESREKSAEFLQMICEKFSDRSRVLPGGYIYTVDVLSTPGYIEHMGEILASRFLGCGADFVITVETKGIIAALMTARALNLPLVILRRDHKLTEGPVVTINYISGTSNRMQTMSISTRAIKRQQKALIIDDFMKGGGTAKAICSILSEFDAQAVGIGVLIATTEPKFKAVDAYVSLLELSGIDAQGDIRIQPSAWLYEDERTC
ncbi:MAG: pur operon repressor [Christensenellales bacterium]|jgi:purine operon repressor